KTPEYLVYAPFVASLVLLGVPHGALDHLVPARLTPRISTAASVLAVGLVYLALASSYLALWFSAPVAAFALFVALTWFHWGQGDLWYLLAANPAEHPTTPASRLLTLFVRGGLPMLVPLLAFPEVYSQVAASASGLFGAGGAPVAWVFEPSFRIVAGCILAALTLLSLVAGFRSSATPRSVWRIDAAETLLLAVYFVLVPPVLAIGVYFCLWHAPRHIARLILLDKRSAAALNRGILAPAAATFARETAPLTLAAIFLLAGVYFAVPERAADARSLLGVYLVAISLLTLPHVIVVSWMDLRQGIWR
ncbi:MAG TPA: Brp/Blh family beta-carotene 15,15'-dioxygenase, partial [Rubrobacteraceae bacterium]|nr:Brp/Blh family beta-carotene 15,15'-dioxygenase [Rubrobacteraceae bacterium]